MTLNTTVYANVVLNVKTFAKSKTKIHFSMLIRALQLEKKNGTKRNQGTFRIDTIV